MAGFTPGPWVEFQCDGDAVAIMPAGRVGDVCTFGETCANANADARLIAAAPELYEALRKILADNSYYYPIGNPWGDEARTALAKATGSAVPSGHGEGGQA